MSETSWQDVQRLNNIAFLNSQIACANIEALAMVAANKERESRGESLAYPEEAFARLIDKYGIGHNSALDTLRNGL